jgi:hypothetical protein
MEQKFIFRLLIELKYLLLKGIPAYFNGKITN